MATDPVCGASVEEDADLSAEYSGQIYYFCSPDCQLEFEDDPERFVGWGGASRWGSA